MNPKEMLFELKPCDECSHSCVEGQFGVKCPYDLIVEPLLNKTKMKTQKEIEELAESQYGTEIDSIRGSNPYDLEADRKNGYIKGYSQCQEGMADISVRFAEWIRIKDFQTASMNNWIGLDMKYYTTKELFEQFIQSLNKQD